jgi:hypothetical protein
VDYDGAPGRRGLSSPVTPRKIAVPAKPIYILGLMAAVPGSSHTESMHVSGVGSRSRRYADNELYDSGCDLVEAATAIRYAAAHPEAARAVPALLGCFEVAMHELAVASTTLEQVLAGSLEAPAPLAVEPRMHRRAARMERGFTNLYSALDDAEGAAAAARGLVARSLAASAAER